MTVLIRPYRPADRDAVVDVWEQATRVAHPFLSAAFVAHEREQVRTVHLKHADVWLTEERGTVTGFIALIGQEVGAIFVRPAAHRGGLGRALLAHAQALRGDLDVEVFERNRVGRAFYDKCGFRPKQQKVHDATGETLLRLHLPAAASLQPTDAAGE